MSLEGLPENDEEALRRVLAHRLHGGVQQTLTVACMELSQASAAAEPPHDALLRSLAHVRSAFDEIGMLVEQLRATLEDGDDGLAG